MDTPSHFFSDCLAFEDANSYQSPGHDAEVNDSGLQSFQAFDGKLELDDDSPLSANDKVLDPRAVVWEGFAEQLGAIVGEQKSLFVDPGLYEKEEDTDGLKAQIQVLSDDSQPSQPSTRRTSSTKSISQRTTKSGSVSTDITPPDQDPPKKRKARRTKREANMIEEEHKRSRFLERNRIAASKCREKKKQYVSDLEETKIGLETQHAHLQMEYNGLLGEVSGLKHHLMAHAKCNDPNIDRWLDNEARRFVQTSNELFGGQPFPNFGGPNNSSQTALPTSSSPRSRNASIASTYQAMQGVQLNGFRAGGERQGSISYSHG